jgi:hypothetical protein
MRSLVKPHKEALFVIPGLIRHPALPDSRFRENDENGVLLMNSLVIIKGLIIELTFIRKFALAPLFQRGDYFSLCQREARRDFIKQCRYYYETVNIYKLIVLQRIFPSFPNSLIGNPGFSMTSGFRFKPGMTAKSHCLTVFIEKFAVVLDRIRNERRKQSRSRTYS